MMVDDSSVLNPLNLEHKFEEYANFVRDVLRPNYQICQDAVQNTRNEISEYNLLMQRITNELIHNDYNESNNPLMMNVDLGHGKVSCRAMVDTTPNKTIFVHVGLGFHVEYTWDEALLYIQKRINYLNLIVLPYHETKAKKVLSHIQSSENILDQLSHEMQRLR